MLITKIKKIKNKKELTSEDKKKQRVLYKRDRWRNIIYKKIEEYIDEYTNDNINDIFDDNDDVATLRRKFKEYYSREIYFKHISPQQSNMYQRMKTYIKNKTKDDIHDVINKDDERWSMRTKFIKKYGEKIYFKHISEKKTN